MSMDHRARWPVRAMRSHGFSGGLERQPPDHRVLAEAGADAVDGVLGLGSAAVDEIGGVGLISAGERAHADAEQTEFRAVGFAFEQRAGGGEDFAGKLRRARRTNARGCGS